MAPYVAISSRVERLSVMSFIILNEASICGPVKIDTAALTTLERFGYLPDLNTLFYQLSRRKPLANIGNSLSTWKAKISAVN